MVDVPRRPPLTESERIRNVVTSHASLSGDGSTSASRPVNEGKRVATVVPPPTPFPRDRLKVAWISNSPNITTDLGGSQLNIPSWPLTFDSAGTSVGLNPGGDDGRIYLFDEGVYACNLILQVGGDITGGRIRFSAKIESGDFDQFDVALRDGDYVFPFAYAVSPGTSRTFYHPGGGVAGGGISFWLGYTSPSNTWGQVWVEVLVQRVS